MEFTAQFEENLEVPAPVDRVRDGFANLDNIARCYGSADKIERVDEHTLHITLEAHSALGKTFQGSHRCRFDNSGEMFVWRSLEGHGNMHVVGQARFHSIASRRTKVTFRETVTMDMPISGLLARAVSPFVERGVRTGIKSYLEKMRSRIAAQDST